MLIAPTSATPLLSIQVLRGVAALGVAAHHITGHIQQNRATEDAFPHFVIGAAGVDLFFVISGFVMVYASAHIFGTENAPTIFFLRRLARIAPLYWVVSGYLVGHIMGRGDPATLGLSLWGYVATFAFIPFPRPDGAMLPIYFLGWTLNYEMFFYTAFAIALLLRNWAVGASAIVGLLVTFVTLGTLVVLPQPLRFWSDPIILEFCFGMGIAVAYLKNVRLSTRLTAALLTIGTIALIMSAHWQGGLLVKLISGATQFVRIIEWGLPSAAIVAAAALRERNRPELPTTAAFGYLGDASYSLYLVHPFTIALLANPRIGGTWIHGWVVHAPWTMFAIYMLTAVAIAFVVHLSFERPVTRVLHRAVRRLEIHSPSSAMQRST